MGLTNRIWLLVFGMLVVAVALVPNPSWAVDAFLKLADCDGPVKTKGFEKQIHLIGFDAKVSAPVTISNGGVAFTRPVLSPIEVLKDVDQCSPQLYLDSVTNKAISSATITFVQPNLTPFFEIKLTDVFITSLEHVTVTKGDKTIQDAGSVDLNSTLVTGLQEVVGLTFFKIQLTDLVSGKTTGFDQRTGAPAVATPKSR